MNARSRVGAVLAAAVSLPFLIWLVRVPDDAGARPSDPGSSDRSIGPMDALGPASPAAPEGIDVFEPSTTASVPLRLAAGESSAASAPETPAVAAQPPAGASAPATGTGLLDIESGEPLSITADELEAIELPDGRRQLLFTRSVNVEQGGLVVRADRLEAHYAADATQPERLVASGNVRVEQKSRQLSCAKATYFPAEERLECVGNARLRDGSNQVDGERIEILFAQDRIRVQGGAVVNVAPGDEKSAPATAGATP